MALSLGLPPEGWSGRVPVVLDSSWPRHEAIRRTLLSPGSPLPLSLSLSLSLPLPLPASSPRPWRGDA
ncbi:hypothetical protein, partial [Streptomyces sp. NPDC050804]|uniref:hypothetical protein n=1 Tax=Streptomyces sp. NPDC050804 TaxID=3154745 RepID=UPI00341FD3F9